MHGPLVLWMALWLSAAQGSAAPLEGRVTDARSGEPIRSAEIAVTGVRGSALSDEEGRFRWAATPAPPFVVIVILPDGRVGRPITVERVSRGELLLLSVEPAIAEALTISGATTSLDVAPGTATAWISGAQIAEGHPATLAQAVERVPGVSTISEGQGAVPALRGLARGRTVITLDGGRVSTERRAGPNASFIDPGEIGSVEVARGPGSVAYGSDAFGGIIAVQSRRPDHRAGAGARLTGTIGTGVPMAGGSLEARVGYGAGGMLFSAHARDFDDYDSPDGAVSHSSWRTRGAKAAWEHGRGSSLWSAAWEGELARDIGRPRSDSNAIVASSPFENTHRLNAGYRRAEWAGFQAVRVDGFVGWSSDRTQQERLPNGKTTRSIDRSDQAFKDVQLRVVGDRRAHAARLQFGAELLGRYGFHAIDTSTAYDAAGAIASTQTSISVASARRTGAGIFVQAELPLSERVRLTGGVRADAVGNTTEGGYFGRQHRANAAVAGLAALTFVPRGGWTLTAQASRGFRDPTLSDRFYRGPVGRGFVEGNPGLSPETSLQLDVVARFTSGRFRASGSAYHYDISQLIERYVVGGTNFFYRNRGKAALRGVEGDVQVVLPAGFAIEAASQWSQGRDATDHTPLDDVAPNSGSVVLRYAISQHVSAFTRASIIAAHDAAGPSEVPTPGYSKVDAGVNWRIRRSFEIRGAARNLLDKRYYSSAGPRWVYGPGRQVSVTAVVDF